MSITSPFVDLPVSEPSGLRTLADLLAALGNIDASRVRFRPAPGTATEKDVLEIHAREKRLCELVQGVLVEKPMGYLESMLAVALSGYLRAFVLPRNLGVVTGEAGMMRLYAGLIRIPDVSFASWDRFPDGRLPSEPIPDLVPDLAVEILSPGNTPQEMARKLDEYFRAGVRLVWIVDPRARTVTVHTSAATGELLQDSETLSGGAVLPGFELPLATLFAELDRHAGP